MEDALIGAIVGGLLALMGGVVTQHLQNRHLGKVTAKAILVELDSSLTESEYESSTKFYLSVLDAMIATGEINDCEIIAATLNVSNDQRYPIYYANAGTVGHLPGRLSRLVVRFHSLASSLVINGRILLTQELPPEQVRAVAYSLKCKYEELLEVRQESIQAFRAQVDGGLPRFKAGSSYQPLALEPR